jgi:hypothetical protein
MAARGDRRTRNGPRASKGSGAVPNVRAYRTS